MSVVQIDSQDNTTSQPLRTFDVRLHEDGETHEDVIESKQDG